MDFKEMNPLGLIGIIGAIIIVIGVFMNWIEISALGDAEQVTGWDIYSDSDDDVLKYTWVPLACLILGIISIVAMVLPTVLNNENTEMINNILGIATLVLSVVSVVFLILFMTQDIKFGGHTYDSLKDFYEALGFDFKWCIGFYLCFIGAVISLVGGVMPILKNKGIIKF